jgi:hypothetical protein
MRRPAHAAAAVALAALLGAGTAARADALPPRQRALLLLRILVYDRNLATRAPGDVLVAIVYRPGDPGSEAERDALLDAFESVAGDVVVAGRRVRATALAWRGASDLESRLAELRPAAAFVTAALAKDAGEVARATRRRATLSAAGSREMVEAGIAIGVVNLGRRAGLVVNVAAAREEGADLDAALLALAEVIPPPAGAPGGR